MHSVAYLIRKDILLVYRYMLILLPLLFYAAWSQIGTLLMYVTLPATFMLITSCTLDMQNRSQRFTASLPVSRTQIVLSKYSSIVPFTLIGILFALVLQVAARLLNIKMAMFGLGEVGMVVGFNLLLTSIYLPLYFWLGPKGMQIVRFVFIMIIAIGTGVISGLLRDYDIMQHGIFGGAGSAGTELSIASISILILLSLSIFLSLKLYARQDI